MSVNACSVKWVGLIGLATAIGNPVSATDCRDPKAALTPAQVVDAQFAAYNARDLESFAACYADDISMTDLSGRNPVIKGQAGLRKAFAYLAKPGKGAGVEIVERIVNGPIVIDRERPLNKTLPDLIAVYEVRGGKIVNAWFPPSR
jgi:hypothetical protein